MFLLQILSHSFNEGWLYWCTCEKAITLTCVATRIGKRQSSLLPHYIRFKKKSFMKSNCWWWKVKNVAQRWHLTLKYFDREWCTNSQNHGHLLGRNFVQALWRMRVTNQRLFEKVSDSIICYVLLWKSCKNNGDNNKTRSVVSEGTKKLSKKVCERGFLRGKNTCLI